MYVLYFFSVWLPWGFCIIGGLFWPAAMLVTYILRKQLREIPHIDRSDLIVDYSKRAKIGPNGEMYCGGGKDE